MPFLISGSRGRGMFIVIDFFLIIKIVIYILGMMAVLQAKRSYLKGVRIVLAIYASMYCIGGVGVLFYSVLSHRVNGSHQSLSRFLSISWINGYG